MVGDATRPRFFYGWVIVAAGDVMALAFPPPKRGEGGQVGEPHPA